jgi:hypothetical protein
MLRLVAATFQIEHSAPQGTALPRTAVSALILADRLLWVPEPPVLASERDTCGARSGW